VDQRTQGLEQVYHARLPVPLSASAASFLEALPPGVPVPLRPDPPPLPCARAAEGVAAGFPSPADDYIEARIDLHGELIPSPLSTFLMRVRGDAMRAEGILDGDLLVVDRSVEARPGRVVVAVHAGSFLVRRLERRGDGLWLVAADGGLRPPLQLGEQAELWGVAIHAIHHLTAPRRRA
jgi:DNA polymerase V